MGSTSQSARGRGEYFQSVSTQGENSDEYIERFVKENVGKVIESAGIPMRILSPDFKVLFQNSRMEALTGVTQGEMTDLGLYCFDQFSNGEVCGTENCTLKQLTDGTAESIEVEVPKQTFAGTEHHVVVIAEPIKDDDGNVIAISESFRDNTEIKGIVDQVTAISNEIQAGNLAVELDVSGFEGYYYDMGVSVNRMIALIGDAVQDIESSVGELAQASSGVGESSEGISDLAAGQSEQMDRIADEVSNLSATVEEVAASAQSVRQTTDETAQLASKGNESAVATIDRMDAIKAASATVGENTRELHDAVGEITEALVVIDNIADQTNLLALNANIEAARAGDAGSGFAVVANEVKKLAEETRAKASEIEGTIDTVQTNAEVTIDSIAVANEEVERGNEMVIQSMRQLEEITDRINQVATSVAEVSSASEAQASSAEKLASTIDQAARDTREIANEVQNIAAMNQEQLAMVTEIDNAVTRLNGGTSGAPR